MGQGRVAVIVPAAGMGERLGAGMPKALLPIAGVPLLVRALWNLSAAPSISLVVVAAPPDAEDVVRAMFPAGYGKDFRVVPGGASRHQSVGVAMDVLPVGCDLVLVHDAARALAPAEVFERVVTELRDGAEAVVPVMPVVDTVKRVDADGRVLETLDRRALRLVQTPQGFRRHVLEQAHAHFGSVGGEFTDDAGLVESMGVPVVTVPGSDLALKVTHAVDVLLTEALLAARGQS